MAAYYNENEPATAAWLRELIRDGLVAAGDVDERSIVDVQPSDLDGYTQCHFFAGIGGWSYALRLALWPDDRPVWTGSCPCQPFSAAGKRKGFDDERHLWPVWRELIRQRAPAVVFGEQVAAASDWLGLVRSDLEAMGRAVGAIPVEAASAGADHLRDRFWFVAHANDARSQGRWLSAECSDQWTTGADGMADAHGCRGATRQSSATPLGQGHSPCSASGLDWVSGADGKARRVKPGVRLLAHGFPARVGLLRGFGNAIDPRPAAAFIRAADEAMKDCV